MRAHCQAIDIKEALVGRQPNFIYLILFYFVSLLFLCLIRYMIMRSHEKIKKIKNRVKNRRKKFFTLEDARAGVQRPEDASGGRSTPEQSIFLALNAQNKLHPGV